VVTVVASAVAVVASTVATSAVAVVASLWVVYLAGKQHKPAEGDDASVVTGKL
jgi:hypothetical protein